ncbi:MAG TPA: hypothetical protein VFV36_05390 [Candidatus Methylomirabilis sp.]|nr:hypothetical protein [Candidatus Methylomirabilis sp.]
MREFGEVARIWAARRLKLPVERIGEVSFESSEGYYYSEYTNEYAHARAIIQVVGYSRAPRVRYRDVDLLEDFAELLGELVRIAQEGEAGG